MRARNIQKIIRLNRSEAQDLQKKAKKACVSEAGLIRLLLKGYEPREKPDEKFYDAMRELSAIGNNINQIAHTVNGQKYAADSQIDQAVALVHRAWRLVKGSF